MEYDLFCQVVCQYVEWVLEKLCKECQYCWYIFVFIKMFLFVVKEFYYGNVVMEKLFIFIQDIWDIIVVVIMVLECIWKDGYWYVKVGVMLNDFIGFGVLQLQLFDECFLCFYSVELMKVFDGINYFGLGQFWFVG